MFLIKLVLPCMLGRASLDNLKPSNHSFFGFSFLMALDISV